MSKPNYKNFAQQIMDEWPDVGECDGFALQEIALNCGILIPTKRTKFCNDPEVDYSEFGGSCNCREYFSDSEAADGFECYRLADGFYDVD